MDEINKACSNKFKKSITTQDTRLLDSTSSTSSYDPNADLVQNRPDSPTGSTYSNETIKPSSSGRPAIL